jgi:hypothetical protein
MRQDILFWGDLLLRCGYVDELPDMANVNIELHLDNGGVYT